MFDLDDARVKQDDPIARLDIAEPEEVADNAHPLDSTNMHELHGSLLSYYRQEMDRQGENRFQMAADEDFYDGIQWEESEAAELRDRGQKPIVYNVIAQSINWILGSERRSRMDFVVLPRRKEEGKQAEAKTNLLKYLSDVNRTKFSRSRAFADAVKCGLGWMEISIADEDDGEPISSRCESWRNIIWDSADVENDLSNARYLFRSKWVDVDVAKAFFPERAAQIDMAVVEGSRYGAYDSVDGDDPMDSAEFDREDHGLARSVVTHQRRRVRLIECWYKKPVIVPKVIRGPFKGEAYAAEDPRHDIESVAERPMMQMHVAIMTYGDMLYHSVSPYRHNRFPFVPIWGYRRGRDGLPYGAIRQLRDIQDDINKRATKALHILSTNKIIMEEGAVEDVDQLIEEAGRADAVIIKRAGKQLDMNADRELAPAHLELMGRNIQMVQQVGGVTDELMGRKTNATSGIAIQARQEQGSVTTNALFDNLRFAEQMRGELELSLVEQFMTEEKQFRILGARGNAEFMTVNDGLPENDITRTKADFVISEQDWQDTLRQASVEQLMSVITKLPPQVGMTLLDLVVENMDISNRDELVRRIRQVTGQKDPDQNEPTPEEAQAMQQQQQLQQMQQQQQMEMAAAQLAEQKAKAEKLLAEAARIKRQAINDNVTSMKSALEAAVGVISMPSVAPVADSILDDSGWPEAQPQLMQPPQQAAAPFNPPPAAAGLPPQGFNQEDQHGKV